MDLLYGLTVYDSLNDAQKDLLNVVVNVAVKQRDEAREALQNVVVANENNVDVLELKRVIGHSAKVLKSL